MKNNNATVAKLEDELKERMSQYPDTHPFKIFGTVPAGWGESRYSKEYKRRLTVIKKAFHEDAENTPWKAVHDFKTRYAYNDKLTWNRNVCNVLTTMFACGKTREEVKSILNMDEGNDTPLINRLAKLNHMLRMIYWTSRTFDINQTKNNLIEYFTHCTRIYKSQCEIYIRGIISERVGIIEPYSCLPDDIDKALDTILDETLSIIEYIGTRCE